MQYVLRSISAAAAACLLASCGGGSAEAPPGAIPVTPAATPTSGRAVDGYLSGATVVCDSNANGLADAGEVTVSTDTTGLFTFGAGCTAALIASGGTSIDTGLPFRGKLRAPAGATVISPLTTLLSQGMTLAQVNTSAGLPAGTALTTTDPALRTNGSLANADLARRTLVMQQLMQQLTDMFTGLVGSSTAATQQAVYGEVAAAVATLLAGGGALMGSSAVDATLINSLAKAATQRIAASTTVAADVKTAVTALNADALAQVVGGGLKLQTDALLAATAATLVDVTRTQQADARIASFVTANKAALGNPPGAATAALATALTAQISGAAAALAVGPNGELVTFEESPAPVLTGFGGAEDASIVADPAGGTGKVAKIIKATGSETWAGTTLSLGPNQSIATIPFAVGATSLRARVWSPDAGIPIRLKVENAANSGQSVETEATVTTAAGWQVLTWNFANPAAGTAALNLATTYNKASIFFDFGKAGTGKSYYVDDLSFGAGPAVITDYLFINNNSISTVNGSTSTAYTMAQFQSAAGISVSWPLPSPMTLRVGLSEVGSYAVPGTISAAVAISEVKAGGLGEASAYIDTVNLVKTAGGLQITIPKSAGSLMYAVSSDGKKKAIIDFGANVAGITNTLKTALASSNSIILGEVVNFGINKVSNDFTGIYGLRGKYKVTIVLTGLPLRQADGTAMPPTTVVVPTAINSSGAVTTSKTVTGIGLTGYITLTD